MNVRILTIDEGTAKAAIEHLRHASDQAGRAASSASAELTAAIADGTIKDGRTNALKIVALLADAHRLSTLADSIDAAPSIDGDYVARLRGGPYDSWPLAPLRQEPEPEPELGRRTVLIDGDEADDEGESADDGTGEASP